MNNKVVWVFGCSASGKETFIKEVVSKKDIKIIEDLGWKDKNIISINESINYIKQYEEDPIGDKRIEIIDKVIEENKNNSNSIILIKGQHIDFKNNLIEMLKEKVKDVNYEVIFLFSDLKTIFERGKKKPWFTEEDNNINDWYEHMYLTALKVSGIKNMKIIAIDSTNEWKISEFPKYNINN